MVTKTISQADVAQFQAFILAKARTCLHQPEGLLTYRYVTPTFGIVAGSDDGHDVAARSRIGHYLQMYDWDSCLFSTAQQHLGLTGLATDVVKNFLRLQREDGYVPRTISPGRVWDGEDLCKPFMAQALLHEQKVEGDKATPLTPALMDGLGHFLSYFERRRHNTTTGLYHWRNVLESGVDDNLALISPLEASKDENPNEGHPDGRLFAVDLCSYLVGEFRAFSELALMVGDERTSGEYRLKAEALTRAIEGALWDEQLGMYCNFDPLTENSVRLRSWTGLTPIAFGVARPERAERVIKECIMNPDHFLRPAGLATMAASEGLYNQAKRGLYGRAIVCNWQGPVWVLPTALLVRGMLQYGFRKEATELARRLLTTVCNSLADTGTITENYNAETGEPLWAPNFMSWNVLCLELMELLN